MIELKNVSYRRGTEYLVENASLTVFPGERVGILGKNGCGKTSLFKLIQRQILEDTGSFYIPKNWTLSTLEQESPDTDIMAIEYVIAGDDAVHQLEQALLLAESQDDHDKIVDIHQRLADLEAERVPAKAGQILHGLGFSDEQFETPVNAFSGGWQVRLKLARTLMARSDLLLLDEPTNHLDIEAILWLEKYLKSYQGTFLIIAHDSVFLDRVVTHMITIENRTMEKYTGNYSSVTKLKAEKARLQQKMFEKQQKVKAKMVQFINRFKAKASKAKQAQSRMKALERMEDVAMVHIDSPFNFEFMNPEGSFTPSIVLTKATLGYDDHTVLSHVQFHLEPGMRVALVGKNGQGKSTLIKALSGQLAPLSGESYFAPNLRIGYFAQHRVEQLDMNQDALWHVRQFNLGMDERQIRTYLGGYAFSGDKVFEPLNTFSGGEKARLILALIALQKPHVLLLDEPTNHLDIEMKEALSMAMQNYDGAVVLVSHDRQLILDTMDSLILIDSGTVKDFVGDLNDYENWITEQENLLQKSKKQSKKDKTNKDKFNKNKSSKDILVDEKNENEKKQKEQSSSLSFEEIKALKKQEAKLESQLATKNKALQDYEKELMQEALYLPENAKKLQQILKLQQSEKQACDQLEEEWLAVQEKLNH